MCPDKDGQAKVNMDDDVIRGTTVIKDGEVTWPPPAPKVQAIATPQPKATPAPPQQITAKQTPKGWGAAALLSVGALVLAGLGQVAPPDFLAHFTVFVLSCFIGYMVIWNVTAALHTPLMSVTNAISGIIVIGALLQVSSDNTLIWILASIAILIATINVFGGFFVTQRMLQMFRK